MRLERLLTDVDAYERPADIRRTEITSLAESLEQVRAGSLFFCVRGSRVDGHDLATEAVERGAAAIVVDKDIRASVPVVRVPDVRTSIAPAAAEFYGRPSRYLKMAGVTGTNGKTTVTHMLAAIYARHGWRSAALGTLSGVYTTPPAIQLQERLSEMREQGYGAVAMEVSSAGLVQHRLDHIRFGVAVFTNLTQDHLDYHGSMENYFEAKAMLFDPGRANVGVVNMDDPYGRRIAERAAMSILPYSLDDVTDLEMTGSGSTFTWEGARFRIPLAGSFNVSNALAAATAARAQRIAIEVIVDALASMSPVPGRLEAVRRGQPYDVVVDFAHTPDGLENVLGAARGLLDNGRLIAVMGCGGDRDADKRPKMGAISERLADVTIVTSDNPRSEDPATIIEQILGGMSDPSAAIVEADRRAAIERAIAMAKPGDFVLIAGKGHETTQEIAGTKYPFDDRLVATQAIDSMSRGVAE